MELGPLHRRIFAALGEDRSVAEQDVAFVRDVVSAVKKLNRPELLGQDRELVFGRDPETHRPVIRIVEKESGTVIGQIPAEAVLRMAADADRPRS